MERCAWRRADGLSNREETALGSLQGKVIAISGGARGMGAAEARLFVAEGAQVMIGDIREAEGRALLVRFLISDESAYISGADHSIDGASTV
ncbi:hypothetical protein NSE01_33870 [Novosphingobium sediminis]|uniref:SDR family NAD(P)-dependent oxidoreductase n=1 Tax=Novosphingobium sediminis TaxID=707214 RepID=A0A512APC3_9SPHN|nr:hypothetical protein NSE01_33870 [Novosphingobium sediminis]